jgi:pimeloyl-ACP methyl ester carboxylesterase
MQAYKSYSILIVFAFVCFFNGHLLYGSMPVTVPTTDDPDNIETFKTFLKILSDNAEDEIFALHYQSIIQVVEAQEPLSYAQIRFIGLTLPVFSDSTLPGFAGSSENYLNRSRSLIISWVSPTDRVVSFFRLKLPKNWDRDKTYPLYVDLHGLTSIANDPIEYMTNYYLTEPSTTYAFEDGYQLSPWGRGNYWYKGISETDIWEGIDVLEKLVNIDSTRKYIVGHSMGGFGAWSIASKSANFWAAMGVMAGALWYDNQELLSIEHVEQLKNLPTYFVVGTSDGLITVNQQAYTLLREAGNEHVEFVTFNGGHEKLSVNVENMYLWLKEYVKGDFSYVDDLQHQKPKELEIYPNVIESDFTLNFNLAKAERITLKLYDLQGREVATILNRTIEAGRSKYICERGTIVSGLYYYSTVCQGKTVSGKLFFD